MSIKFIIDYNEATDKPEIQIQADANDQSLAAKMLRQMYELASLADEQQVLLNQVTMSQAQSGSLTTFIIAIAPKAQ